MKILDVTYKRKVNCSANVCLWNHWDHDHINYTHKGIYNESQIFYEDDIQKAEAKEILEIFNKELNGKIQTNISRLKNYCKAEEYHQKYIEKNR